MRDAGHIPVMEANCFGVDGDGRGVYFDTVDVDRLLRRGGRATGADAGPKLRALAATRHPSPPAPVPHSMARRHRPHRRSGSGSARIGGVLLVGLSALEVDDSVVDRIVFDGL